MINPTTYSPQKLREFCLEHHPRFKEWTVGRCAYTSAAYKLAFSQLYPELSTRLAVLTGHRYDFDEEDYINSLIHVVLEVKCQNEWVDIETTDEPAWDIRDKSILDQWSEDYVNNRENVDPHVDGVETFTDDWEAYWKECERCGSPRDDELVESFKQQILDSFKGEKNMTLSKKDAASSLCPNTKRKGVREWNKIKALLDLDILSDEVPQIYLTVSYAMFRVFQGKPKY